MKLRIRERLGAWWRRLRGRPAVEPESAEPFPYECGVCGTGVDDPDAACPLCRSTDIVAAGARPPPRSDTLAGDRLEEHVSASDDDAVERLRAVQSGPLGRHDDKWRQRDGGYEVELPAETVVVESVTDVERALREAYD